MKATSEELAILWLLWKAVALAAPQSSWDRPILPSVGP